MMTTTAARTLADAILGSHVPPEHIYSVVDVVAKDDPGALDDDEGFADLCNQQLFMGRDDDEETAAINAAGLKLWEDESVRAEALAIVRQKCVEAIAWRAKG